MEGVVKAWRRVGERRSICGGRKAYLRSESKGSASSGAGGALAWQREIAWSQDKQIARDQRSRMRVGRAPVSTAAT